MGAGPAGFAVSAALAVRGLDHIVLEQARVGETGRTQRWDSFRLNTFWEESALHPVFAARSSGFAALCC